MSANKRVAAVTGETQGNGQARRTLGSSRIQNNERKVLSPRQHAFLLVRSPVRFASTEELIHSGNEMRSGWRSRYAPGKDPFEGN